MAKDTVVISHLDACDEILDANVARALNAMGNESIRYVKVQMEKGYNEPHITYSSPSDKYGGRAPISLGVDADGKEVFATHTAIYDSGELEGSINYRVNKYNHTVAIGTNVHYAKYVHEGTYKLHGRPFLRDAIKKNVKNIMSIAKSYLQQGFD